MVDNTIKFLFRSKEYAHVQYLRTDGELGKKFVYSDGTDLAYGDKAEILGAVMGDINFWEFIESALSESYFSREHYWYTFGYQEADLDNKEIKENEVRVHYAGVDNTITKKDFFELCILLCKAKPFSLDYKEEYSDKLSYINNQLKDKIRLFCPENNNSSEFKFGKDIVINKIEPYNKESNINYDAIVINESNIKQSDIQEIIDAFQVASGQSYAIKNTEKILLMIEKYNCIEILKVDNSIIKVSNPEELSEYILSIDEYVDLKKVNDLKRFFF